MIPIIAINITLNLHNVTTLAQIILIFVTITQIGTVMMDSMKPIQLTFYKCGKHGSVKDNLSKLVRINIGTIGLAMEIGKCHNKWTSRISSNITFFQAHIPLEIWLG